MKVYNLCCEHEHRFEGWFTSEKDFMSQLENGLVACPLCESSSVTRRPSAPRLNFGKAQECSPAARDSAAVLQAAWMEVAREVIARTEDVGERFADEVRRIHYSEAPERGIRGTATHKERDALAEEGIDVMSLPLPAALKLPVQ
ncbi:MAG: hypothetical protein K0S28_1880 [Paucimonas sp.]|jgi:hypothetical protein|nr:hypothetical protein [Paucimonas sp.]